MPIRIWPRVEGDRHSVKQTIRESKSRRKEQRGLPDKRWISTSCDWSMKAAVPRPQQRRKASVVPRQASEARLRAAVLSAR